MLSGVAMEYPAVVSRRAWDVSGGVYRTLNIHQSDGDENRANVHVGRARSSYRCARKRWLTLRVALRLRGGGTNRERHEELGAGRHR